MDVGGLRFTVQGWLRWKTARISYNAWKPEGWEVGMLKDGRWDVVKMRCWAALERESLKARKLGKKK